MICERCQSDEVRVTDTRKCDNMTIRIYMCKDCDSVFKTKELKTSVRHYNSVKLKSEWVDLVTYRERNLWDCSNKGGHID